MSESDRSSGFKVGLAVAAALIAATFTYVSIVFFLSYQEDHANERKSAATHQTETADKGPDTCRPVMVESGVVDWLACFADAVTADGDAKQSQYDLNAQQDMAEWALLMAILTAGIAIITLAGVIFVWLTLKATQDMATTTSDIGEKQVSAYLSIVNARLSIRNAEGYVFWMITPEVRNSGQSPASDVKIWAVVTGIKADVTNTYRWPDLGSGMTFSDETQVSTKKSDIVFFDAAKDKVSISFLIRIKAKNVFGSVIESERQMYAFTSIADADDITLQGVRTVGA